MHICLFSLDVTPINQWKAKKFCRDKGGFLPMIKTRNDIKGYNIIATDNNGQDMRFWIDLTHDDANRVVCDDLGCDNSGLYWERDFTPFNMASLFSRIWWDAEGGDYELCANMYASWRSFQTQADIHNINCYSQYSTICEYDCETPTCPTTHPFNVEEGAYCCKWYNKINDPTIDPACDGGHWDWLNDPASCCPNGDFIACPFGRCDGDNPNGDFFCPTDTKYTRVNGTDKGLYIRVRLTLSIIN